MSFPKISVVTVSYNQANYLEQTIKSVLNQNYPNLEYIIIDGGSTDGSDKIIRNYEKQLAYWTIEKDNGMYDGLQKGFNRSTGDIMAWINSDDIFHPRSFFVAAQIFMDYKEVSWLQGMPSVIDEVGRTVYVKDFRKWSKYNYFLRDKDHIQQESTFWRRDLWEKAGGKFDGTLKLAGDYELWLRYFDYASLHCVRTLLGAFRMRNNNQLSLDRMDEYNMEVESLLLKRLSRLSANEKEKLKKIERYNKSKEKISLFRTANTISSDELFEYPRTLSFDRKKQSFRFES